MGLQNDFSRASILWRSSGAETETAVTGFTAHEQMSGIFRVMLRLAARVEISDFDAIIGQESLTTVAGGNAPAGGDRYFHGVVRRFEHSGRNGRFHLYEAEVVPGFWQLSLRRNTRIFQGMQAQDIIRQILKEGGIVGDRLRFALMNKERLRKYCVQYRETDLDFVSRLLEEEGIYYFFEHYRDRHVLVMGDNPAVHPPIAGEPDITFNTHDGLVAGEESVSAFSLSQRQRPGTYTNNNFNFKNPALNLTTQNRNDNPENFEIYDYPSLHVTEKRGETLARTRLEQLTALRKQGCGRSSSSRLTPGYTFSLTDHDSNSLNGQYLIVSVNHSGAQPQSLEERGGGGATYGNTFVVIPAATPFRPPYPREKPVVKGVQTATVVGPKGEEIHTDDYGRVKVQFHWDREGQRDEKSSCWLRVAQAWGGLSRGGQFVPRIGDEVLVDFIDGDPDRPIVTGSVYNADNMPINSLKKSITQSGFKTKTHKGDGFHELRFDDAKGKEEIFLQSERDWKILVKNDKGEAIGHDETLQVSNDRTKKITRNQTETIGGDSTTTVTATLSETAKEIVLTAETRIVLVCGQSTIVVQPGLIDINSPLLYLNSEKKGAPEVEAAKEEFKGGGGEFNGGGATGGWGGGGSSGGW